MNHEPITIAQIVAQAARRNNSFTANTEMVRQEAISDCLLAMREGRLVDVLPSEDTLYAQVFDGLIKSNIRGGTSQVRKSLERGQVMADLGDDYDITITVCGPRALKSLMGMVSTAGRTTTLGNLTADDIDLTVEELRLTYEAQKSAYYASRDTGGLWSAQLRQFSCYRVWRQEVGEATA